MGNIKLSRFVLIFIFLSLLLVPYVIASHPVKSLVVVNLDYDRGYKYKDLFVDINFPDKDKSPFYTVSFIPTTNFVMFGLVDKYQYNYNQNSYMVSENGSVNITADLSFVNETEPYITAPIIYTDYVGKENTKETVGWYYLIGSTANSKESYNAEISDKGHASLAFYGYLLPLNVTKNTKFTISFRRMSDFKGFDDFLFPFAKGTIKINLLLPENTSFSNIKIEKYNYPPQLVSYKFSANKIYFENNLSLPLQEDSEFIRYSPEYYLAKNFERLSILSINVMFGIKLLVIILAIGFYFLLSIILFFVSKKYRKSSYFFSYQLLIFATIHVWIYPAFGIASIYFTILDLILVVLNLLALFTLRIRA